MTAVDLALVVTVVSIPCGLWYVARRRPRVRLARMTARRTHGTAADGAARAVGERVTGLLAGRPGGAVLCGTATGAVLGQVVGGPVAAVVLALYAAVAVGAWRYRVVRQRADRALTVALDAIDAASADLRAGLVPGPGAPGRIAGLAGADPGPALRLAAGRVDTAYRISEALGTPLADLLDQVDTDLRAGRRLRAGVEAQTAGARTSAVLLVGLPLVGLWLGAGLGVDPLGQLLHTRIGAGCAIGAALLQCGGLLWTNRIVGGATAGLP